MSRISHQSRPVCVSLAILLAAVLAIAAGCKTQQDAAAASSQMATTSKTLSDYYSALDTVLSETQDAYEAQAIFTGIPPEDLSQTRAEIQRRIELAKEIGNLSGLFTKLTGSSAAGDASAAGGKLADAATSIKSMSSDDTASKAVSIGVREIVALIQENDEKKAAEKISPLTHNLVLFFESEKSVYDSINEAYLRTAQSVAKKMVENNQVDASPVFASSLQPFGMTPDIADSQTKTGMQKYLADQIDSRYTAKLKAAHDATDALDKALKEMDARIDLVAHDKPMSIRTAPFSLDTVESWIAENSGSDSGSGKSKKSQ